MSLIERIEQAEGPSRELDAEIWYFAEEKPRAGDKLDRDIIGKWPRYTLSIDAALMLYMHKPDVVSTCPRKVCADALRQRIEVLGQSQEGGAR